MQVGAATATTNGRRCEQAWGEDSGGNGPKDGDHFHFRVLDPPLVMTDDAPVIFKRKQSKLSQSSRVRHVEGSVAADSEDGAVQESEDSPAVVAARVRKQQKVRQKPKPPLSFGGDNEVRVSGSP